MYDSFGEFVIALHSIDKEAAQWLGKEVIKAEKRESQHISKKYLTKWPNGGSTLGMMLTWADTPQGSRYWGDLNTNMWRLFEGDDEDDEDDWEERWDD